MVERDTYPPLCNDLIVRFGSIGQMDSDEVDQRGSRANSLVSQLVNRIESVQDPKRTAHRAANPLIAVEIQELYKIQAHFSVR
jgi:hypothetical protein